MKFILLITSFFYFLGVNAESIEIDCNKFEDDSLIINKSLIKYDEVSLLPGTCFISRTIFIPEGKKILGRGFGKTIIKMLDDANVDMLVTEGFYSYTGTKSIHLAPTNFSIQSLTIDGNYLNNRWNANKNSVNNEKGSCIKIYGSRFNVDVEVINCPDNGLYVEGNGKRKGRQVSSSISLFGKVFGKEALVFRGPGDIVIKYAVLGLAGILPKPIQKKRRPKSKIYSDYNFIDGVVIDRTHPYEGTVEIDFLHTFANFNGVGFRTRGRPRLQAQHIISESNLGGVVISPKTWGAVSILDIHSSGKAVPGYRGTDLEPLDGLLVESKGPFIMPAVHISRTKGSGRNWVAANIVGSNLIMNISVRSTLNPATNKRYKGDAILIKGDSNIVNATIKKTNGMPLKISGDNNIINATIIPYINKNVVNEGRNNVVTFTVGKSK